MGPLAGIFAVWLVAPAPGMAGASRAVLAQWGGTLVAGTESGLFLDSPAGWLRQSVRGGVQDLAQGPEGLWIAAQGVLYRWPRGAQAPRAVPVAAGASVRSLAVGDSGEIWAATDVGLFRRAPGARFEREASIPAGRVAVVRTSGDEVWASARGRIWRRRALSRFEEIVRARDPGRWMLVAVGRLPGGDRLLAVPEGLWRLRPAGDFEWISVRDRALTGLVVSGGALWLAGAQGLTRYALVGEPAAGLGGLAAPVRILDRPALALQHGTHSLRVATPTGVLQLDPERLAHAALSTRRSPGALGLSSDRSNAFPIAAPEPLSFWRLGGEVLAYQGLEPEAFRELEWRSRGAGWLPVVRATLGVDRDRSSERDRDEVFSSGAVRQLFDRGRKRASGLSLDLRLTWSLARLRDPGDSIAISRERRERSELRDQILDRVTRLYFERERVLARLAALAPDAPDASERSSLGIRERELRARLDAWSGGGFTRRLRRAAPPSGPSPSFPHPPTHSTQ